MDMTRAVFSPDRRYRYVWERDWSMGDPARVMTFIMLNPSLADEQRQDPTVTRCLRRAVDGGYNVLRVLNLFARISPYPKDLLADHDPVGPYNDRHIERECKGSSMVIAAWGSFKLVAPRALAVRKLLDASGIRLHYLRLTGTGKPWHPLHLPYTEGPKLWA